MNSKNILITIASLALILIAVGVKAQLYFNSNSATVVLDTSALLTGSSGSDSENETHCSKTFVTSTYFNDVTGVYDPMTITWSAPPTLPASCVNNDMVFDEVEIRVSSAGNHWNTFTKTFSNSTGLYNRNKEWVNGDTINTHVTFHYILD